MVFDAGKCGFNYRDNHNTSDMRDELGATYSVGDHTWMYVKATAAVAAGEVVISKLAHKAVDVITAVDNVGDRATGKYPSITDSGLAATANAYVGSFLYLDAATAAGIAGQMKRIVKNSTTQIWYSALFPETGEADEFATDPDLTDTDITIISPFQIVESTADTPKERALGVAVGAFTSGYYGYIICGGPVLCNSGTGNNALIAGSFVVAGDDTAGQCSGVADGNDLFDATPFGFAMHAAADDQKAPIWVMPLR